MKVSEVIAHLHRVWEEHGDLEVQAYNYSDIDTSAVETPEVVSDRRGSRHVVLRP
ncbi:hypothetical protein ABZ593_20765 [Streptomyces sp. NPDC012617]|uniref:hypothetical protein n=1 Tax=Streptomyces TaxID=1883 RepID=UPI0033D5F7E9